MMSAPALNCILKVFLSQDTGVCSGGNFSKNRYLISCLFGKTDYVEAISRYVDVVWKFVEIFAMRGNIPPF